jgi:hypothetical protein
LTAAIIKRADPASCSCRRANECIFKP